MMASVESKIFGKTVITLCPDCDYRLDLGFEPEVGQIVTCPDCWASLQVISVEPLELDWEWFDDKNELTDYTASASWELDYFDDDDDDDDDDDIDFMDAAQH